MIALEASGVSCMDCDIDFGVSQFRGHETVDMFKCFLFTLVYLRMMMVYE